MPPATNAPVCTTGTCDYATFHGKRDFAGVIQVKDFETEKLPGGPDLTIRVHKSGEPALAVVTGRCDNGRKVTEVQQKKRGEGGEGQAMWVDLGARKGKEADAPLGPPGGNSPVDPSLLVW